VSIPTSTPKVNDPLAPKLQHRKLRRHTTTTRQTYLYHPQSTNTPSGCCYHHRKRVANASLSPPGARLPPTQPNIEQYRHYPCLRWLRALHCTRLTCRLPKGRRGKLRRASIWMTRTYYQQKRGARWMQNQRGLMGPQMGGQVGERSKVWFIALLEMFKRCYGLFCDMHDI
jgi:hypothetical protein